MLEEIISASWGKRLVGAATNAREEWSELPRSILLGRWRRFIEPAYGQGNDQLRMLIILTYELSHEPA